MLIIPFICASLGALSVGAALVRNRRRHSERSSQRSPCYIETLDGRIMHISAKRKKSQLSSVNFCVDSTKNQFPPSAVFISQQLNNGDGIELIHMSNMRLKLSASADPFCPLLLAEHGGKGSTVWKDNGYGFMCNSARPSVLIRVNNLEVIPQAQLERIIESQRTAITSANQERTDSKKKLSALGQKVEMTEGQIVRLRLKLDESKAEVLHLTSQLKSHRVAEVRSERDLDLAKATISSLESQVSELKLQAHEQGDTRRKNEELDLRCSVQEEALRMIKARLFALSSSEGNDEGEEESHWGSLDSFQPKKEVVVVNHSNSTDLTRSRDQHVTPPAPVYQSVKAIQRFHLIKDSCDATPNLASARDLVKIQALNQRGQSGIELDELGVESPSRACVSLLRSKDQLMTSGKRRLMLVDSDED